MLNDDKEKFRYLDLAYSILSKSREMLIDRIYEYLLREKSSIIKSVRKYGSSIIIELERHLRCTNSEVEKWYKAGLELADAHIHSDELVIFNSTQTELLGIVLSLSKRVEIRFSRYYVTIDKKVNPCFQFRVHDQAWYDAARIVLSLKSCNNFSCAKLILPDDRIYVASFLAGLIDGDGSVAKEFVQRLSELGIRVSKVQFGQVFICNKCLRELILSVLDL